MISSVRGIVLSSAGSTLVIDVGGVGLSITVIPEHALAMVQGKETMVHTALIVRDDDLALYGFRDREELGVFDLLRGVTGVGPKSAIGVLAALTPNQIATAVSLEDDAAFRKVTGIGPKTAKLIVLSLAGKMHPVPAAATGQRMGASAIAPSVIAALIGLGWSERVAAQAVDDASSTAAEDERNSVSALLRLALAQLGPRQQGQVTTP